MEESARQQALDRLATGSVWSAFCDRLKEAGEKIVAAAPDDSLDQAEGLRYLSRLTYHFLRATIDESDPAMARFGSDSPKIGLDNPDYIYVAGRLSPHFEYRLRGRLNDAYRLGIGIFSGALGSPKGLVRDSYLTSDELEIDSEGRFELLVSRTRKPGNWLEMGEESNALNIRQTLLRRREQRPAEIEFERVAGGEPPAPLDPVTLVSQLDRVGATIDGVVAQFIDWSESFRGHRFEIEALDPKFDATAQGDPSTSAHYSYWELDDDKVFVVELDPPEHYDYWNLQIGNHWLESLDYMFYDTHVNHETAVPDLDGRIRVRISAQDPGGPNWLRTAGHRRGSLALRWVGASETPPKPRTRVEKRVS